MNRKNTSIWPEIISRVFDPVWEIPAAILFAILFAVKEGLRWRFLGVILFIDAVVPMVFFLTMLYHKQIRDWDLQNRAERIPLYLFTMVCHLGGLWIAHEAGKDELMLILLVFYALAVIFFLISTRWKISLHAGVNTVLFTTINIFYDWKYAWLFLFLPLVMWARVVQKHHTWAQVIAGAVISGMVSAVGLGFIV